MIDMIKMLSDKNVLLFFYSTSPQIRKKLQFFWGKTTLFFSDFFFKTNSNLGENAVL